jgi:uncharacterized repeat protein (TIGR01451 family)
MKKNTIAIGLRRSSIALSTMGTISLIISLVLAFFPQSGAFALVQTGSGAIWTTLDSCGTEEQDTNHYSSGDHIFINGSGFTPGASYDWSITGNPGGSSGDPGIAVASGSVTPDANGDGSFCFNAYTVLSDDWGEYSVKVGAKGDNYRVQGSSPGSISVDKVADPISVPESGGDVDYTITVTNTDDAISFTLESLIDDQFGDLNGAGTCSVPQTIAPLDSYICGFTESLSGTAGSSHVNTVTGSGTDAGGFDLSANDDATVLFTDEAPAITVVKSADPTLVPEIGDDVTFSITVTNIGNVDLTLESLIDDVFGNLNGVGDCSVPQDLSPLEEYSCSFTELVSGEVAAPHVNTVTATATDAEQNEVSDEDDATVEFTDILPDISVSKSPSTPTVIAPGGNVTFTVTITNLTAEPVQISSLVDSDFGDLNGAGTCSVPQDLAANGETGDSYVCSFTGYVSGAAGATHNNVVTANGFDSEQNEVSGDDDAIVNIIDDEVPPPPLIPVTGVDLGSGIGISPFGFASFGMVLLGLGIVINGYTSRREQKSN